MGAMCSTETYALDKEAFKLQAEKNRSIDADLERDRKQKILKLLILGPGESGKSTTIKQIKIIHDAGYSHEEKVLRKYGILMNILEGVDELHTITTKLNLQYSNPLSFDHLQEVRQFIEKFKKAKTDGEQNLAPEVIEAIFKYKKDETISKMLKEKTVYNIDDSTIYFLDNFPRIISDDYIPTEEDILKSRVATSGVVQYKIVLKNFNFRIFDVGGQRAQRRKWLHVFDDVHAVLFITSLSEYDQVLREDESVNRMKESLNLFEKICNGKYFYNTAMILFLNKIDLFEMKIKHTNINVALTSYKGAQEKEPALEYIRKRFTTLNKNKKRTIYTHETCATDTQQIQVVIDSVIDVVIQHTMQKVGIQ
ncbi:unnamed protein product [Caenorhabditis angaria]|uniref:Uncharacterized protein n=1 Tax=Caenorhabditis angaria TaxID=860376 RepID=A0A9P1IW19_9PELO|nr:unnamed protein product [Caenorhabditis angaria]